MIKLVKEQKESQLKYFQMVLYTIKSLLPIKDILKKLPSSGLNIYIYIYIYTYIYLLYMIDNIHIYIFNIYNILYNIIYT